MLSLLRFRTYFTRSRKTLAPRREPLRDCQPRVARSMFPDVRPVPTPRIFEEDEECLAALRLPMEPRSELPTDHAEREGPLLVVAGLDAQKAKLAEVVDRELAGRRPGEIPARMVDVALHCAGV